ncbi:MAG: YifB family Mg chelatase-like AAA ATPase [Gammaproteobacteria bacterium]|nr:YifB family Mg chelatase-like AAA ATPase [Gammaproteobacteria bacterium]
MSLTQLKTRAQLGINAPEIRVEVHISNGLPSFTVVGLPETVVREARDRVRSAIINSGFEFPARRITVNLAPADLPKEGGRYDLPIALGILGASEQIEITGLKRVACFGELALSGACCRIEGLLPALIECKKAGESTIIPQQNSSEASLISGLSIQIASSLAEICRSLNGGKPLPLLDPAPVRQVQKQSLDLAEVKGQYQAKRALEIAAAGGHHMLMLGPPGTGKSMLARRLATILPLMSEEEAMSSAAIRSLCQQTVSPQNWFVRPYQSPHHTVSGIALAGGGRHPKPGEISLAHNGVLFLDELAEFDRRSIEVLREPLETGRIHISRASAKAEFPAQFQLIAAMNPCPGGCDSIKACDCSSEQLNRYRNKLSAPLLDRIDIQIELARLEHWQLINGKDELSEPSKKVRTRVQQAHEMQLARQGCLNAQLGNLDLVEICHLGKTEEKALLGAFDKLRMSARSYHKLLKLARTIADLSKVGAIAASHVAEAISYRRQDRRRT